jgi:hypothetical protein
MGGIQNVKDKSQVTLTVNGSPDHGFRFEPATGVITRDFRFYPGSHRIEIVVSSECGSGSESKQVHVEEIEEDKPVETPVVVPGDEPGDVPGDEPVDTPADVPGDEPIDTPADEPGDEITEDPDAGWVRINPGNSSWEFCLQTPGGDYNRSNLSNPGFSYSGPANSLFIKPIAGGGMAKVNNKAFRLNPGQYYLFEGTLKVQVTNKRQGAMGHWSVYIESRNAPSTGKGNKRPKSPCDTAGNRNSNRNR